MSLTNEQLKAVKSAVNDAATFMVSQMPFFADVLMQSVIEYEEMPADAAMTVKGAKAVFYFSPLFTKSSIKKQSAIIVHEIEHFFRLHPFRGKKKEHKIWNYATDMAINQLIENIPKDSIFPEQFKLEEGLTEEAYYEHLLQVQKEQEKEQKSGKGKSGKGKGKGDTKPNSNTKNEKPNKPGKSKPKEKPVKPSKGGTDSKGRPWINGKEMHPKWIDAKKVSEELGKAIAQDMANRAERATRDKGDLPAHMQEIIDQLNAPPKINWKQMLKQYVGTALKGSPHRTWSRPTRRGSSLLKGWRNKNGKRIVYILDTSGSMSSKELMESVNELKHLQKTKEADTWFLHADAAVAWAGKIEQFNNIPKEMFGRGGTNFCPAFNWAIDHQPVDLLIYYTDGAGTYPEKEPPFPVIWIMTEGMDPNVDWGRVVHINEDNK